jgi:transcription antitermination factor NusG
MRSHTLTYTHSLTHTHIHSHTDMTDDEKRTLLNPVKVSQMHTRKLVFNRDDRVVVIKGDLTKLTGRVKEIRPDGSVIMVADEKDLTEDLPFAQHELTKYFRTGESVCVCVCV